MASLFNYSIIFTSFIILSFASAAKPVPSFHPKALVLPVFKDKCSKQYVTKINQRTPLVPVKLTLDLGGRFLWVSCDNYVSSSYKPVSCGSVLCRLAGSVACNTECFSSPKPGCHNNTCGHFSDSPIIQISTLGDIGQDVVSLQSFNGKSIGMNVIAPDVPFICSRGFMLENLADGALGMAGLGRSNISLPAYFLSHFSFQQKFAMCLSSLTNSNGVIFFGDGPNSLVPNDYLTYTPLIRNPASNQIASEGEASPDYYIQLKTIKVGGKEIKFNKTLLSIEDGKLTGGTKISTVHPYTVLHTSIYKPLVKTFLKQMRFETEVNPPIAPFGACFRSSTENVPLIDLVMESSVSWRILGANSMVKISSYVMCLGFVDGGLNPESSIIIGGHQLEDNLLEFDLASSRLGFSSNLLVRNTSCSNFN